MHSILSLRRFPSCCPKNSSIPKQVSWMRAFRRFVMEDSPVLSPSCLSLPADWRRDVLGSAPTGSASSSVFALFYMSVHSKVILAPQTTDNMNKISGQAVNVLLSVLHCILGKELKDLLTLVILGHGEWFYENGDSSCHWRSAWTSPGWERVGFPCRPSRLRTAGHRGSTPWWCSSMGPVCTHPWNSVMLYHYNV